MINDYSIIGIFLLIGTGFVLVTFLIAKLLRPHRPSKTKLLTYECGEPTMGSSWIQYNVGYYIFALIFVIFDVEVVFLFPWAVAFKKLGLFALIEMFIFLAILIFGLIYAWRKGALRWV
ncbi:MAG: NADH-quinone oxidoreductase subunit A [candidate division Zixibacteria bacterium]